MSQKDTCFVIYSVERNYFLLTGRIIFFSSVAIKLLIILMKKPLLTMLALGALFGSVSVFADNDVIIPSSPVLTIVSPVKEKEESSVWKKAFRVKYIGDNLIKERINALTSNMKVVAGDKSLTTEQKTALTTILTTNINGLTTLRATLASSTDATTTKALVSSIFSNFRIYGIVIPQVRIEKRIYDLQNHSTKLSDIFLSIQKKINDAKVKGNDVTVWQKSLDDAKVLVANDMNTLTNLFTKVALLKPADYGTTSKAVIESANKDLRLVLEDFNTIKKNAHRPSGMNSSSKKINGDESSEHMSSPLSGTSWIWVSSTVNGSVAASPAGGKFVVSFGKENRVHSTTDCNSIGGRYTVGVNGVVSFGPFMSTMMHCEGSHQLRYSQALSKTSSYTINGTSLTLTNASGTMLFTKK